MIANWYNAVFADAHVDTLKSEELSLYGVYEYQVK